MNDNHLKLKGNLKVTVENSTGITREYTFKNLVVTSGLHYCASRIASNTTSPMSHMAIGSGTTVPSAGNTTLATETARVAILTSTSSDENASFTASFPSGTGTGTVAEAGIFSQALGGNLLCRSIFDTPVEKAADESISIVWTITFGV